MPALRSAIKMRKRNLPQTCPYGTPNVMIEKSEAALLTGGYI